MPRFRDSNPKPNKLSCMAKFAKAHSRPLPHGAHGALKMELFATISNGRKLKRTSSDELITNRFLKFAEHLPCQKPSDARFYKKKMLDYTVVKDYM